jgi:O-antigen/teichoic acid export membrane protein
MNRIFENTSSLFLAQLIGRIFSLSLTLLLATYFRETELGQYVLATFITNMIASIAELGMHAPLIREMTLNLQQARHFIGNALIIRIFLSIVAFGVMLGTGHLLGYSPIILQLILLLGIAELINLIAQLFRSVFRAFEQVKYEAITVIVERVLVVFVGGVLIILGIDLIGFCVIVLIASFLNLVLSVVIVIKKFTSLRFKFDLAIWSVLMSQALPFALGNIFNLVYFRIDMVMLSKLSPSHVDAEAVVAWYWLAYTIVNAFTILPGAFMMGAMFPVLSRTFEDKRADFASIYTYAFRWMFLLGVPFAVGMAILAPDIADTLDWLLATLTERFQTSSLPNNAAHLAEHIQPPSPPIYAPHITSVLRLLSASGGLIFLTTVMLTVLRAADKRLPFTLLMGTTLLLNVGLNYIVIPGIQIPRTDIQIFSHTGAAVTMIVSEVYLLLASFIYISLRISKLKRIGFAIRSTFLAVVMGVALVHLRDRWPIWGLIPAAIVFYFGGLAILGEFLRGKMGRRMRGFKQ